MANIDAAFGFRPIKRLDGAAWTGNHSTRKMLNNASALNRGDVVQQLASGYVAAVAGVVADHSALGVFVGCHYLAAALGYPIWSNYWPGSGAIGDVDVFVIDDPNVVFEVQAAAGPIALADVGMTANPTIVASTTGFSKWSLAAPAASATAMFRVGGLADPAINVGNGYDPTTAFNIVQVAWNDQIYRQMVGV
jgi:hypothetical protein